MHNTPTHIGTDLAVHIGRMNRTEPPPTITDVLYNILRNAEEICRSRDANEDIGECAAAIALEAEELIARVRTIVVRPNSLDEIRKHIDDESLGTVTLYEGREEI
jgi:hypothetical protein